MNNKKYHTFGTVPKSTNVIKINRRNDTPSTPINYS